MYGSWDAPQWQAGLPTEVNMPITTSLSSPSSSSSLQPFTTKQKAKITQRHFSRCKYCIIKGHFAKNCTVPHHLCHWIGGNKCLIPKAYHNYLLLIKLTCSYVGFHSVALYRQVEQSGIDDGEEVLRPRAYLMCHAFICTYILLYASRVRLCVPPDRFTAHTGQFRYLDT